MNRSQPANRPANSSSGQRAHQKRKDKPKWQPASKIYLDAVSKSKPVSSTSEPKKSDLFSAIEGADAVFPLIDAYSATCVGTYNNDEKTLSLCRRDQVGLISKSMHFPGVPSLYMKPKLPLELRESKELFKNGEPSVTHLLVAAHRCNIDLAQVNFVTERYNLNLIGTCDPSWCMGVQKIGNSILLMSLSDQVFTNPGVVGFKFEAACTVSSSPPAASGSFLRLISSRIGSHSLLLLCETDAVVSEDSHLMPSEQRCVELKTCKEVGNKKLVQWWLQSFLGGVAMLAIGYKGAESTNDHCRIDRIEETETHLLLRAKSHGETSLGMINAALSFLSENVQEGKAYLFRRGKLNQDTANRDWQLFALPQDSKLTFITPNILSQVAKLPKS
jgi:hypothetical protein